MYAVAESNGMVEICAMVIRDDTVQTVNLSFTVTLSNETASSSGISTVRFSGLICCCHGGWKR